MIATRQRADPARLGVRAEHKRAEVSITLSPVRPSLALDGTVALGSRVAGPPGSGHRVERC